MVWRTSLSFSSAFLLARCRAFCSVPVPTPKNAVTQASPGLHTLWVGTNSTSVLQPILQHYCVKRWPNCCSKVGNSHVCRGRVIAAGHIWLLSRFIFSIFVIAPALRRRLWIPIRVPKKSAARLRQAGNSPCAGSTSCSGSRNTCSCLRRPCHRPSAPPATTGFCFASPSRTTAWCPC